MPDAIGFVYEDRIVNGSKVDPMLAEREGSEHKVGSQGEWSESVGSEEEGSESGGSERNENDETDHSDLSDYILETR